MFLHVTEARHLGGHRVELCFNDGTVGQVDLSNLLHGPIFEPLRDVEYFRSFSLEGHTLSWSNGADFAPEYLRSLVTAGESTPSGLT
jgi:hypothetical protein